jgi:hypothetical protein
MNFYEVCPMRAFCRSEFSIKLVYMGYVSINQTCYVGNFDKIEILQIWIGGTLTA